MALLPGAVRSVGEERGWRPPTYEHFLAEVDHGSMYVGSPETVARRIAEVVRTLDLSRFHLHYAIGRIPHEQRMAMIDLYGREVIPRVRELLAAAPNRTRLGRGQELTMAVAATTSPQRHRGPPPGKSMIGVSASSAPASSARRSPVPQSRPATTSRSQDRARPTTSRSRSTCSRPAHTRLRPTRS